jgi:1,4-dihydroxy-2-naphthoate polyprenyltransferase
VNVGLSKATVAAWYQASRPPFFVATVIPLALGGVLAAQHGAWDTTRWLVVLLASFFVHLNTNLANDYFDHFLGADAGNSIGGSRALQEGSITLPQYRIALVLLYFLGLLGGLWLLWDTRLLWLIPVMLFSFFSSLYYVAPPIKYGYRGLGEFFVFLNMGPVMVAGTYGVLAGAIQLNVILLSIPTGIMVAMILFYQSLPDMETDVAVGKRTLAVRLGKTKALWAFRWFYLAAVGTIVGLVFENMLPVSALASVLTLAIILPQDRMIRQEKDWTLLHDRGKLVRLFYLANGLVMILSVAFG